MGSGQAYVRSALAVKKNKKKLFAVNVWVKSQAEGTITQTHTSEINFFIGAATNIKHFCKSNLLASLTCFVGVSDKREEQKREDQRECGVDYHSTAPQRETRGEDAESRTCLRRWGQKEGEMEGEAGEKRWEMWYTYLTWHVRSARFFELLGSDGDAHIGRRFRCWSAERRAACVTWWLLPRLSSAVVFTFTFLFIAAVLPDNL